jgi:hypothetical protein
MVVENQDGGEKNSSFIKFLRIFIMRNSKFLSIKFVEIIKNARVLQISAH